MNEAQIDLLYENIIKNFNNNTNTPSLIHNENITNKVLNDNITTNNNSLLSLHFRREARSIFLEEKANKIPTFEDLKILYSLMNEFSTIIDKEPMIGYLSFSYLKESKKLREDCCKKYILAKYFLSCPQNNEGYVLTSTLFNLIQRIVLIERARLDLSYYDAEGNGQINEEGLNNWIFNLIQTFFNFDKLEEHHIAIYVCTAVRKILFMLETRKKGVVLIKDIVVSPMIHQISELRTANLSEETLRSNWFSFESVMDVYGTFLKLDTNEDGLLSISEIRYWNGGLTIAFVERLFQVIHTTESGMMDFTSFVEFVLAMSHTNIKQGISYCFKALDLNQVGYISSLDIIYFFKNVLDSIPVEMRTDVNVLDIIDEIFDMTKPKDALKITIDDLVASKCGKQVLGILISAKGFINYENRESLVLSDSSSSDEDEDDEDEDEDENESGDEEEEEEISESEESESDNI
jgi:serine/threonine-protein phosphatase 2A regulatory subunit B''